MIDRHTHLLPKGARPTRRPCLLRFGLPTQGSKTGADHSLRTKEPGRIPVSHLPEALLSSPRDGRGWSVPDTLRLGGMLKGDAHRRRDLDRKGRADIGQTIALVASGPSPR